MAINPQFLAAREAEERQRLITHLPHPPALRLVRKNGGTIAFPVVHLTPRHVAELFATGNALVTGGEVRPRDVFQVLWRLHPYFIRPSGEQPNLGRLAGFFARISAWRLRARLTRLILQLDWRRAMPALRRHLDLAYQDQPAGSSVGSRRRGSVAPSTFWLDDLCDYYSRSYSIPPEQVIDRPYALLFQLYRNQVLATDPEAELKIFAPSDALLA